MKTAKAIFNILCGLTNVFLIPYVIFKIYGYYSPEVGFELPNLTYWNVFAINIIAGIFLFKPVQSTYIGEIHSYIKKNDLGNDDRYGLVPLKTSLVTLISWFFGWLIYIIVF